MSMNLMEEVISGMGLEAVPSEWAALRRTCEEEVAGRDQMYKPTGGCLGAMEIGKWF